MMQAATMYQEDSSSPMPYAIVLGYDSNNIPSNQDQIWCVKIGLYMGFLGAIVVSDYNGAL